MFFSKRALWVFALAAAVTVLTPGPGICVEKDLYIYRILFGSVYFEYETGTSETGGSTLERQRFMQSYSLDTLGNILSRRLAIYDAGVRFTFENYEQGSTTVDTDNVNYYLQTTLLPKSNIPLTLYGNQSNDTTDSGTGEKEHTKTTYGLNWLTRFRNIPDTKVRIERQNDVTQSSDMTTSIYNVIMNKDLGPTENMLSYTLNTTEDNFASGRDSQNMAINATNRTNLSRSTIFDLGFSRGESTNENIDTPDMTANAVSVGLQSRPSQEFSQGHRFSYYALSSGESDSASNSYSGNMSYQFTDRLNSNLTLTAGESTTESPGKSETTTSLGTGFGLNYRVSKKLSMSETVNYSKYDSSANTETNRDRELFRALTHLTYNDQLSWAQFIASTRLGYNRDKTTEELSGTGIEHGISAALANIDINRYFLFNTSADWNRVYNLTGDNWSNTSGYNISASNKLWRRYVQLAAKFSKTSEESWVASENKEAQNWSLSGTSTYFRNTRIEATMEHIDTFDSAAGDVSTDIEKLTVTHNRYLARGLLDIGFNYNFVNTSFTGGSNEFSSMSFFARYNKRLLRQLDWRAEANYTTGEGSNDSYRNITVVNNYFTYPMRRWLLSLEQKYLHTESQGHERIENTFLFRAMRQFVWIL